MKTKVKKMLVAIFTVFLFINPCSLTLAQNQVINWGENLNLTKYGFIINLNILKSEKNFIYFQCRLDKSAGMALYNGGSIKETDIIVKYDKTNGTSQIFEYNSTDYYLINYIYAENNLHVFLGKYDKVTNIRTLFHTTFDFENFKLKEDISKFDELSCLELSNEKLCYYNLWFEYENHNYLLKINNNASNPKSSIGFLVYNTDLKKISAHLNKIGAESGFYNETNYQIDNEGNVYALQRNFENKKDIEKHFERSRLWLVYYPKNGDKPKSLLLLLNNDYFITSNQLSFNEKGDIICAGLYANPGTTSAIGCFSFVIDSSLTKIKSVHTKEFDVDFITKGMDQATKDRISKIAAKKQDFDDEYNYVPNKIHFKNDGSFDLIFEKFKLISVTYNLTTTMNYFYSDLFVLNYNTDGSIKWIQKVLKYENVIDNGCVTGSYLASYDKNENMNLLFNLSKQNSNKATTVLIKLDNKGNENFKEIVMDQKKAAIVCPKFSFLQSDNILILSTYYYNYIFQGTTRNKNVLTFGEITIE